MNIFIHANTYIDVHAHVHKHGKWGFHLHHRSNRLVTGALGCPLCFEIGVAPISNQIQGPKGLHTADCKTCLPDTYINTFIHSYTYIHTYLSTYTHMYIHTYNVCIHTYIYCIHTYMHTCVCALFFLGGGV